MPVVTHEDAFLRAVLADPDDDAPRLIYADWLEERGDPKGEFIRVQCALAKMAPDDDARPELEDRERELLEEHEPTWAAPLRGLVENWRFRRGFVDHVTLPALQFLDRAAALYRLIPLQKLSLRGAAGAMEQLAGSRHLARLGGLNRTGNFLTAGHPRSLLASRHLGRRNGVELAPSWLGVGGLPALADPATPTH